MDDEDCSLDEVVGHISTHFRLPLEAKGISVLSFQDKVEEVIDYAQTYLNICQVGYTKVWYTLSLVLMLKNGPTSSIFVNWHSVCHSPMEEWSRCSPP
jgi:hypothetical protein